MQLTKIYLGPRWPVDGWTGAALEGWRPLGLQGQPFFAYPRLGFIINGALGTLNLADLP